MPPRRRKVKGQVPGTPSAREVLADAPRLSLVEVYKTWLTLDQYLGEQYAQFAILRDYYEADLHILQAPNTWPEVSPERVEKHMSSSLDQKRPTIQGSRSGVSGASGMHSEKPWGFNQVKHNAFTQQKWWHKVQAQLQKYSMVYNLVAIYRAQWQEFMSYFTDEQRFLLYVYKKEQCQYHLLQKTVGPCMSTALPPPR